MPGSLANLSWSGTSAMSNPLTLALAVSLALHAALIAGLPDLWTYSPRPATAPLNARIEAGTPAGEAPAMVRDESVSRIPPAERPPPKPAARKPSPMVVADTGVAATPLAPAQVSSPNASPTAEAPAESPPPVRVAVAVGASGPGGAAGEPTLAPRAGDEALDYGSLAQYRLALIVTAKRHRLYPSYAVERGWHGRVGVRLAIGADGELAVANVYSSSGHTVLDAQALEMLRRAKALTPLPPALRNREFTVDVPVVFELKGES